MLVCEDKCEIKSLDPFSFAQKIWDHVYARARTHSLTHIQNQPRKTLTNE